MTIIIFLKYFKNENNNDVFFFKIALKVLGYYCQFIYYSFKFLVLPNNEIKINNHSHARFLN